MKSTENESEEENLRKKKKGEEALGRETIDGKGLKGGCSNQGEVKCKGIVD